MCRAQGGERSLEKIGWRLKNFRHDVWISFSGKLWGFLCFSMILDVNLYLLPMNIYDYLRCVIYYYYHYYYYCFLLFIIYDLLYIIYYL